MEVGDQKTLNYDHIKQYQFIMNTKNLILFCLIYFLSVPAASSASFYSDLPNDSIISRIWRQNALFPREKIYTMTDKSVYIPGDTIWFRTFLVDATNLQESCQSRYVLAELISPTDTLVNRVKIVKDKNSAFYGYLRIPYEIPVGEYSLRCYTKYLQNWKGNASFARNIKIVKKKNNDNNWKKKEKGSRFHVGFYPEGGTLIAGNLCRVAFKAENKNNGLGVGIHGWIIGNRKDTVCYFQTSHRGMGDFSFIPQSGVRYHAICRTASGEEKHFDLPLADERACALKVVRKKDVSLVSAIVGKNTDAGNLRLLAVTRECPVFAQEIEEGKYISFPDTLFKSGIVHFFLLKNRLVASRRSIFVTKQGEANASIHTLSDSLFRSREKTELELQLTNKNGKPLNGIASLTITDAGDLVPDSLQTICSELLLSSDLNGTIEDPAWYFRHPDKMQAHHALDLVMCIHAWCRYDVPDILKGNYWTPTFLPETSMTIEGRITTRVRRSPIEQAKVTLHVKGYNDIGITTTDSTGYFHFNGFEFPDSTIYMLSSERKNGRKDIVLTTDSIAYPPIKREYMPKIPVRPTNDDNVYAKYVEKAIRNISVNNDIRHYLLGDVTVTARKPKVYETEYEWTANNVIKEKEIRKSGIQEIGMFIRSRTGVDFFTFRGGFKNKPGEPSKMPNRAIVLDGNPIEDEGTIKYILDGGMNKDDVQQIDILKGTQCVGFFGAKYDLIIAITTNRGSNGRGADYTDTNFAYLVPLGLQKPVEFYSPHYKRGKSELSDLRTTIYWKPNVQFKNGKANVSFYTADSPSTYTILVEGIAENEEPFRLEEKIFK